MCEVRCWIGFSNYKELVENEVSFHVIALPCILSNDYLT